MPLLAPPPLPAPLTLGIYLGGSRIGYASYVSKDVRLDGKPARRSDSTTRMRAGLIGQAMEVAIDGSVWTDAQGRPLRIKDTIRSAGRTNEFDARFGLRTVKIVIMNGGERSVKEIPYPAGPVVDDPLTLVGGPGGGLGRPRTFYLLDPLTASFVKNEIRRVQPPRGVARAVEIVDPRANSTIHLGPNDEVLRVLAPMGMEMVPMSRQAALVPIPEGEAPDLANLNRVVVKGAPTDDALPARLVLRVSGADLKKVAGDGQRVEVGPDGTTTLTLEPTTFGPGLVAEAARLKPEFLRPSLYVPSDDPAMVALARKIVGPSKTVRSSATLIRDWVGRRMTPNAGIGVLRDAREVLKSSEGVCRDYAALSTTLLRAAGVPARVAGGLVLADGALYYHAWSEVWDGRNWVGVDATRPGVAFSAGHIRLGSGTVEEAFTFPFWGGARVEAVSPAPSSGR